MTVSTPSADVGQLSELPVLVVDDQEVNRVLLSRRLKRVGYAVEVASDGQEALERIKATPVELVLLDIMMPDMNGIEFLEALRENWSRCQIPVIMLTASAENSAVAAAMAVGANDYVLKPINFPALHERIQGQLRAKRFSQELLRRSDLRRAGSVLQPLIPRR